MIGRRMSRGGRPGLIGVAARTAVVAGTASAVSGRVSARQQQQAADREAAQQAASAPVAPAPVVREAPDAPASGLDDHALSTLERLGSLYAQGLLSEAEFTAAKQRVLAP
ncbi:SHOCT domain-containing protein [Streptacidiphilus sp. N1-3]|uniref:SHOCT domain-containing protein n=1 Tax=Streptacidiphilus alkalitolerans TaxID=3342712 RepID=A0ABV6X8Q0_9ACTN